MRRQKNLNTFHLKCLDLKIFLGLPNGIKIKKKEKILKKILSLKGIYCNFKIINKLQQGLDFRGKLSTELCWSYLSSEGSTDACDSTAVSSLSVSPSPCHGVFLQTALSTYMQST